MKKITLFVAMIATTISSFTQTTLTVGDIVIIGVRSDSKIGDQGEADDFSFVLLTDIEAGTQITFTDESYYPVAGNWRGVIKFGNISEGTLTFTASQAYSAGKLLSYQGNFSEFSAPSSWGFSTDGDQIFAFQGSTSTPTFIFAVNAASQNWTTTDIDDTNASGLPSTLTDGDNAVAVGSGSGFQDEWDNVWYTGITSGTKEQILEAVADDTNWSGNNSEATYSAGIDTSDYTVTAPTLSSNPVDSKLDKLVITTSAGKISVDRGEISAIYNLLGQEVTNENLDGIYIVVIREGSSTKTFKVLI